MKKEDVIQKIMDHKIVAIMRNVARESVIPTAKALYEGGIRLVEVTFNQKKGPEDTVWSIRELKKHFQDDMLIGAGTVMTTKQVELAAEAGALYIISPNTDFDVIRRTNDLGLVSMPGALTPSEVVAAHSAGAGIVKLFPAGDLGVGYIKAMMAPINHIPMVAVGGVDDKNLKEFLDAGLHGAGIGSNIVNAKLIKEGRFAELTELAKKYTCQI